MLHVLRGDQVYYVFFLLDRSFNLKYNRPWNLGDHVGLTYGSISAGYNNRSS